MHLPSPEHEIDDGEWRILILQPKTLLAWCEETAYMARLFLDQFVRYPELLVVHPATWKKMRWIYKNGYSGEGELRVYLFPAEVMFADACCRVLLEPELPQNEIHIANAPDAWWGEFDEEEWLASFPIANDGIKLLE